MQLQSRGIKSLSMHRNLSQKESEDPEVEEESEEADRYTCKMTFRVPWDEHRRRWFVPKRQSGCIHHNGHPRIDQSLLRVQPRHALPAEEIDVAETALESHIGPSQTAALVQTRTGVNLDARQLQHIFLKLINAVLASEDYTTHADKLLSYFTQTPSISFVCLFANFNSGLLTIKQKARSPNSTITNVSNLEEDLGDEIDSPVMFARSMEGTVRDNLTHTASGLILLLASWTTDTARRKFDMYPEFVSIDDTEGTNIEERPLSDWCAKDGDNKVFPFLFSFLPSKAEWAYAFTYRAAAILHPGTALARVVKINTDAYK